MRQRRQVHIIYTIIFYLVTRHRSPPPFRTDEDRYVRTHRHTCKRRSRRTSFIVFIAVSLLFSSVNNVHKTGLFFSIQLFFYFRELIHCTSLFSTCVFFLLLGCKCKMKEFSNFMDFLVRQAFREKINVFFFFDFNGLLTGHLLLFVYQKHKSLRFSPRVFSKKIFDQIV